MELDFEIVEIKLAAVNGSEVRLELYTGCDSNVDLTLDRITFDNFLVDSKRDVDTFDDDAARLAAANKR